MIVSFASLFAIPTWYLLMKYPDYIPQWLNFMIMRTCVFADSCLIILIEFIIGALQIASLNTPTAMGSTFCIIAALVLGEFAVSAKCLSQRSCAIWHRINSKFTSQALKFHFR
jgi:stage V sporulation protein AF